MKYFEKTVSFLHIEVNQEDSKHIHYIFSQALWSPGAFYCNLPIKNAWQFYIWIMERQEARATLAGGNSIHFVRSVILHNAEFMKTE
jgi:hypothetical protein